MLIVSYAPSSDQQLTMEVLAEYMSEMGFVVFVVCILVVTSGLFLLPDKYKKHYVVVYTLICSLTGCLTVMCVKGVSTALILTLQGHNQFFNVLPWVLVGIVREDPPPRTAFHSGLLSEGGGQLLPCHCGQAKLRSRKSTELSGREGRPN